MPGDATRSRRTPHDDDAAIESLFYAHYRQLARTALGLVGDWGLAEQLVQEAYLRLWRRLPLLRDQQAAPAYLRQTVINLALGTLRGKITERRVLRHRAYELAAPTAADPTADLALRRAVAALPARKRACVVLRYLAGMSEAEVADALGVSVGTVKSQTHKALRQLREWLGDQNEAPSAHPAPGRRE